MKHDIEEIVIEALMCGEPSVIVEGLDDIKFYDNVINKIGYHANVQAIETIEGYGEGCGAVIQAIKDIQQLLERDKRLELYILGIIDRDARYYRSEVPNLKSLFVLKYYSYESHLVTKSTIRKQIALMTKVNNDMITEDTIEKLFSDFQEGLHQLYYFSLEALKTSCDANYVGCVTYSMKAGNVCGYNAIDYLWQQIGAKVTELDRFANDFGIGKTDFKYIIKGKWLLFAWCDFIIRKSKQFHSCCGDTIPECQMCKSGKNDKCLWKIEGNFQVNQIKNYLCSYDVIDLNELDYLCQRLRLLAS